MKTYLKDLAPEEIIKRLKNGEILHPVNPDFYIKMIDGVLCEFYNNELKFINVQVGSVYRPDSNEGYDFYFETEEPFEIKETGLYKTICGKKVFVSQIADDTTVFGMIEGFSSRDVWDIKGKYMGNQETILDIISKWED